MFLYSLQRDWLFYNNLTRVIRDKADKPAPLKVLRFFRSIYCAVYFIRMRSV